MEIRDIPLFHGLTDEVLDVITGCLHKKSFDKGEVLFMEGAGCDRIFIISSGRVKLYRTASTGREQILEMLEPGETCACNPGNVSWFCSSTAEAMVPSTVWFLSRHDYVKMVQSNTQLSHTLNELFAKRLQCFTNLIEEISLKDARKRLIKFLLDIHAKKRETLKKEVDSIYLPFTHEEIAQKLGSARETVTRYLSQLKKEKLIEVTPNHILVKDVKGLESLLR